MKIWLKRLTIAGFLLVAVGFLALEALRAVGKRAGVEEAVLPLDTEIEERAVGSDYADAYRIEISGEPFSLKEVSGPSESDLEIFRDDDEVVFEGRAPGLSYLISYHVRPGNESSELTVSTVVVYQTWLGRLYFTPVKQGHRRLLPFFVSRVARDLAGRADGSKELE